MCLHGSKNENKFLKKVQVVQELKLAGHTTKVQITLWIVSKLCSRNWNSVWMISYQQSFISHIRGKITENTKLWNTWILYVKIHYILDFMKTYCGTDILRYCLDIIYPFHRPIMKVKLLMRTFNKMELQGISQTSMSLLYNIFEEHDFKGNFSIEISLFDTIRQLFLERS